LANVYTLNKLKRSFENFNIDIIRNIGLSPSRITKKPTESGYQEPAKTEIEEFIQSKREKAVHHQDVGDGTRSVVLPPSTLQITPWILALYRII
jgi:hypothetical protein